MILRTAFFVLAFVSLLYPSRAERKMMLESEVVNECLEILWEGLKSDDFWPSMHAAEALTIEGFGNEVLVFLRPKLANENDDQRRCGLAREMVRAGDVLKSAVMLEILKSDDPHGHVHAAESLYKVGWVGSPEPLRSAFNETEDIRLKIMAAAALAKHMEDGEAYRFLRKHLADESDPDLFRLTAWVLGRIGDESDILLIRLRLGDTDDPVHRAFLEHALAALGDSDGNEALLGNLKSEDPAICTYAAVFAGELSEVDAYTDLESLLNSEILDVRIRAAQAILSFRVTF